jgi:hypothetical protein
LATPTGERFHGKTASYYVVVEGSDGYKAVFGWFEIDGAPAEREVLVATMRDGHPLGDDGPFRTIAPGDKRAARSVRNVVAIRIRQAS